VEESSRDGDWKIKLRNGKRKEGVMEGKRERVKEVLEKSGIILVGAVQVPIASPVVSLWRVEWSCNARGESFRRGKADEVPRGEREN